MPVLVIVVFLAAACGSRAESPGIAPSAGISTPPIATTAPATARPNPTAGPGVYTSLALGYQIQLPEGWRRSACGSSAEPEHLPAVEAFTSVGVDEEVHTDMGANNPGLSVQVEDNATNQTALQWLRSGRLGSSVYDKYETMPFDGKTDAARTVHTENGVALVTAIVVSARARMYAIMRAAPTNAALQAQTNVMNSVHILGDAELAAANAALVTPSAAPARSADEVADTIARAFAQKDSGALAAVAHPCLQQGNENAGPTARPASAFLAALGKAFASGLVVTVQPRPITSQSATNASVRGTWRDAGQTQRNAIFMLTKAGGTWYWSGVIFLAP
jgi:hypothetical protein